MTSTNLFPLRENTSGFPGAGDLLSLEINAMVPNANTRHFMLKAATRDLVARCGGIERAAAICSYGKSTVGRWADSDCPDLPSLQALFALEEEAKCHDLTGAIASARGLKLEDLAPEPEADNANLMSRHADAVTRAAELMTEGALAFSDSKVTPAEASRMDRAAHALEEALGEYRKVLASVRAAGGLNLVDGGAA